MKKFFTPIVQICLFTLFLAFGGMSSIDAANRYAVATGSWNSTTTWSASTGGSSGASVPAAGDNVYIERGYTVTVTANAACSNLYFSTATTGTLGTLTVNSGVTLTVSSSVMLYNAAAANVSATISGAGTLSCATLNIGNGTAATTNTTTYTHTLTSTISTLTVSGNLVINSYFTNTSRIRNGVFVLTSGTVTVGGTVTTSNANAANTATLTLGNSSPILNLAGATPFSLSGKGTNTITLNGTGATVNYSGAAQTIYASNYHHLTLSGSGNKSLTGTANIQGNFTNNATFTPGTSTFSFVGTSPQTIGGSSSTTFYNLTINNTGTSGNNTVTLQKSAEITNTLTLTSGIVNTTSTNVLSVTNTAAGAIAGGSSTAFVNGPLKRSLPANLATGSSYAFPVGAGTSYYPFTLVNPTTGATAPTVQIEAKAANSGGTFNGTLFSLSTTEYWTMTTTESFTNSSVSVSRPTAISPYDVIAGSTTANGTYTSLGGTAGTNGVTNSNSIGSNRYFVLGRKSGGALWLKADVGTSTTTEGSGVTAWNDQSGTANHATSQLTAPTYQTLGWNFNPIINFLAGYYLSSTDPITDDMTFFAVYSSTQSTSYGSWWQNPAIIGDEANGTQNDYGLCTTGGKLYFKGTAGDNFGAQTTNAYNDGFPKIVSVTRQKSSTGYIYLYVNGTQAASAASDNTSLSDPQKIGIGNNYGYQSTAQYVGGIAEVLGGTIVYSTADRQNFESYLAIKYGVTLSHDYTNSSGTTVYAISGYNYDIAGLGRDDIYNLHQKVSSTSNYASGSSKVIMASNNDFSSSNLASSRTALTNGQFLIWGHNNGAVNQWVNISGTSDYIVNRIWMVQNTNTISNVNFQIDLTGFPTSPSGYYCLKVANNSAFTSGVTNYVLTNTSGNLYSCGNVNFPSGTSYFSISYVKNYWMGSTSSTDWGTASNWTANLIPTTGADVEYATIANYGTAAVNDLQLDADRTIGSLINATSKKLIIPAAKSLTVNNTITISDAQNPNLIQIHSGGSSTSQGTLIFHNDANHPVYATVEMYSKAWIDPNGVTNNKYFWQYFGLPLRSLQANPSFYGAYVRRWDEAGTTISNHWVQLGNNDVIQSFLGYEICQPSAKTYTLQGILENRDFSSGELAYTTTALYPGQHIFGNSYTAAIDITQINFGSNMEATVYLYNTGSYNNWVTNNGETSHSPSNTNPGTYAAIPKNQAGQGGIQGQIPSMQGFLVKAMSGSSGNTISIPYSSVAVKNTTLQRAKAAEENDLEKKQYLQIDLKTDTVIVDRMWIFNEENCTRSFDNGWDGPKMLPASGTPALCAIEKDGLYQVNSVNDMDETKLGFRKGTETEYSLTFYPKNLQQRYPAVYLLDEAVNQAVKIENETVYSFTATGTENLQQRFRIVTRYYEKGEPEEASQIKVFSSKGHIVIDNLSSENGEALIYDISGRKVGQEKFFANKITVFGDYPTGAYVVRASSSKETVTKRIIVQ
jgi:hypothetical protein